MSTNIFSDKFIYKFSISSKIKKKKKALFSTDNDGQQNSKMLNANNSCSKTNVKNSKPKKRVIYCLSFSIQSLFLYISNITLNIFI